MNKNNTYVVTVKCLIEGSVDAETERRNIFAFCADNGLVVSFSDVEKASELDLEIAKNLGVLD